MLKIQKHGIVLEPTVHFFERKAVLNPAIYQDGDDVHLFYRAIDGDNKSSIGYARLNGPLDLVERWDKPIVTREYDYESEGIEDPRIVKIGDTFYMTYVVHDGKNAITAYATSKTLASFKKRGVISPLITYKEAEQLFGESHLKDQYYLFSAFYQRAAGEDVLIWHKDLIPFPDLIRGKFTFLERILPDVQVVAVDDLEKLSSQDFWRDHLRHLSDHVVLESKHWFETRHVGGGAPPIKTRDGWLAIMHGVEETNKGRVYRAGAVLLDLEDPRRVIGKLHEPLFGPTESWEIGSTQNFEGEVANVVFPTGTALFGDTLYIYYGAADKRIAVASVSLAELLAELQNPERGHSHG